MTFEHDTTVTPTSPAAPDGAASPTWAAPAAPTPAPVVPVNQPRKRRASRLIDIALAGAAVLAIAGVAFAVGRATAPAPAVATRGFGGNGAFFQNGGSFNPGAFGQGGGNGQGRFGFGGGLAIDGTVTSVSADSITVKTADGRELTVATDSSTAYHQATPASSSDVAVGDDVSVKVQGGRGPGDQGDPNPSGAPRLSASDVTVTH
jgi:hypothetical protein